jgi:SP family facilitated glucose transporter-like MFS transporter 3
MGLVGSSTALIAVNAYVAFYEIGIGPIPWLIIAEMFEAKYVPMTMSICSQLNWIVNYFVALVFPTMSGALGQYTFVPFGVVLVVSFFFTWKVLPETQGKTPAEMVTTPKVVKVDVDVERGSSTRVCFA